ncbi:class II aldolase/adducin family protein [Jiangella asiatica]|uniref:class II aldolase/adducin family protein n=1 Tax=Jiangella asiatica TaxID=2530372 RepID=UPI00193E7553|nr:class II aldolase/adducin family protein [Jiangella asiatica]
MTPAGQLIRACRRLAALGLSPGGSGNVSVRVGDQVFVTPTGSSLGRVTEDDLAVLTADGTSLSANRPSKEFPLHLAAYRVRPRAQAIVHLHSVHAVAASCLADPLPTLTPYQVTRLGPLPVAPYAPPGSQDLADGVAALMAGHHAVLMANHGSVVAADDVDLAADLAEELDSTAKLALLLRGLPHHELPPDAVAGPTSR